MRVLRPLALLVLAGALAASCAAGPDDAPPELTVYAAASLRDALEELAPRCQQALGVRLALNLGASSDLARQIVAANKADVFVSADEAWMDHVARAGLVDEVSRRVFLSNRLVVIAPAGSRLAVASARDLARAPAARISMASPEAVPAGRYARAWLEHAGVWPAVRERVLPGVDVRAALAAVESGGAELGIVYRTDAAISRRVRVLHEVSEAEGPRIAYTIAALGERPHLEGARRVASWLAGPDTRPVFERLGFVVPARS